MITNNIVEEKKKEIDNEINIILEKVGQRINELERTKNKDIKTIRKIEDLKEQIRYLKHVEEMIKMTIEVVQGKEFFIKDLSDTMILIDNVHLKYFEGEEEGIRVIFSLGGKTIGQTKIRSISLIY